MATSRLKRQEQEHRPKKHLAGTHYAPITVELNLPPAAPLIDWINDFLANGTARKTVTLTDVSFDGKTVGASIEANNAILTEVDFDAVNASAKDAYHLTLVFSAEMVRPGPTTAPTVSQSDTTKSATAGFFAFNLSGVSTDRVSGVAAFTAKRRASDTSVGEVRDYTKALSSVEFSNLMATLAATQSTDWTDWRDNFLVKGNSNDSQEKNGSLDLQDSARKVLFSVKFSHVGMVRLADLPHVAGSESIRRLQAELYYEGASVSPSGTDAGSKSDSGSKSDTGSKTDGTKDTGGKTTDKPDSKTTDDSSGKSSTGGTAADGSSAAASDDEGAHDPADFPRIANLTRRTFISVRLPASVQETATYFSKLAHDDIVSAYAAPLKTAGWEQTIKNESGDPATGTHQYRLRWTRKGQTADVPLSQSKPDVSEVSVEINTSRAGSLPGISLTKIKVPDAATGKGSASDQGARDPADFPRVANSVRKSYTSLGSSSAPQEMAVYSAKLPIDQVEAFYVKNLSGSEWDETSRREAGDPATGSHQITTKWSKGSRTATIVVTETSPEATQIDEMIVTPAR